LERLKEQATEVVESYRASLESLRDSMNEALEPIERELESLRHAVKVDADEFDPILPDRYESPLKIPDEFNGLFDSRRDYLTQIDFYKRSAS